MTFQQAKATPGAFMAFCGIYSIVCPPAKMVYVGQTSTPFLNRWEQHVSLLKGKAHHNDKLQAAYDKHGMRELHFVIIEARPLGTAKQQLKTWLDNRERYYIDRIGSANERRN